MTLNEKLAQELGRLSAIAASDGGSQSAVVEHEHCEFRLELSGLDRLGCALEDLTVRSPALAAASLGALHEIGRKLAERLTYLLETIAVIEVDPAGHVVQLRSQPPHRQERQSSYYELLAARGMLQLRRYTKETGAPRRAVAAHLTREVLLRLMVDFAAAAR